MNTLVKYFENDFYAIYYCEGNYVSIAKNISGNIKTYLVIVNDNNINISKIVNDNYNNCVFYIYKTISNNYSLELDNVKNFINTVYNYLLKNNKSKNDFIKKVEIINDGKNTDFINYMCNNSNGKFVTKNSMNVGFNFMGYNNVSSSVSPFINNDNNNSGVNASSGVIKWYTICFILVISIVVGVSFAIYVLN